MRLGFSIELGWWLIPFIMSVLGYGWALIASLTTPKAYGYAAIGNAIIVAVRFAIVTIAILASWLTWALMK